MTLFDFQLLPLHEKIDLLYEQGVYIGKRKEAAMTVLLYQLNSFYAEVFYKKYRCYVTKIHCFSSTSFLDPYLNEMDVESLVYLQ